MTKQQVINHIASRLALLIAEHGSAENIALLANILRDITREDDYPYNTTSSRSAESAAEQLNGLYGITSPPRTPNPTVGQAMPTYSGDMGGTLSMGTGTLATRN